MSDIRESIRNHLQLSGRLEAAAKEVLYEDKNITDVAVNYGLNIEILHRKIMIMEDKRKFFEEKDKFEKAFRAIFSDTLTIADAARIYNLDYTTLKEKFQKFKESNGTYEYDRYPSV